MRRISAAILVLIISAQAFYNAGVLAYWCVNHAYIAKVLCENRDKPMLHCDGKCYLRKKLAAQQQSPVNPAQKSVSLEKGIELADLPATTFPTFIPPQITERGAILATPDFYRCLLTRPIFHPPGLAA